LDRAIPNVPKNIWRWPQRRQRVNLPLNGHSQIAVERSLKRQLGVLEVWTVCGYVTFQGLRDPGIRLIWIPEEQHAKNDVSS
jgi:hypothetical protein